MTETEKLNRIREFVQKAFDEDKEFLDASSEWSHGNSDDVFRDGRQCESAYLASQILKILNQ